MRLQILKRKDCINGSRIVYDVQIVVHKIDDAHAVGIFHERVSNGPLVWNHPVETFGAAWDLRNCKFWKFSLDDT